METRANYLLVGGFVLALAAGLVGFVLWLAKYQFDVEFGRYDIRYQGSVTGLKLGSPVRYSGVRVGEVIELGLDPASPTKVLLTIEVDAKTPIRKDTIATLEFEGLTGGLYVLLSGGSLDSPPLSSDPGQARPVIASQPSSLQQILEGAPELVQNVNVLIAQLSGFLSPENRNHFSSGLRNLDALTAALAGRREEIGSLIENASTAMVHLSDASGALAEFAKDLKSSGDRLTDRLDTTLVSIDNMAAGIDRSIVETASDAQALIQDLHTTAQRLGGMSKELQDMVAENRSPIREFTASGLNELTGLLIEMRDLVVAVNRVTTEIQRDPARFFFGNQQQGYETR